MEREIRDDGEVVVRERHGERVRFDDSNVRISCEAAAQAGREMGAELDRVHVARAPRQLARDEASARSDVDNVIGREHSGVADELGRERAAAKEVLASACVRPRTRGAPA